MERALNILMLPSLYYPNLGGVEIAVDNLCRQLVARGHKLEIVTTRWPRDLPTHDVIGGIKVTRLPFVLPSLKGRSAFSFPVRFLQSHLGLERVLRATRFDLVNLHYLSEASLYANWSAHKRRIPLVVSVHGSDIEGGGRQNSLLRWVARRALKSAAAVTSNSSSLAGSVRQLAEAGLEPPLVTVANGVNVEDFSVPAPRPSLTPHRYLLGVGRLVDVKGFDTFIRAFARLAKRQPDVDIVLVGDGVDRGILQQLCVDLGMADRVHFAGRLPNNALPAFFQHSEFLVIPSRREGFGIVALEAMASRKAVVAMAVGGLQEVVSDRKTGLLVKEQTAEGLAKAMSYLLAQPQLAGQFGERGRERVESRYTWKFVADCYLGVFSAACLARPTMPMRETRSSVCPVSGIGKA